MHCPPQLGYLGFTFNVLLVGEKVKIILKQFIKSLINNIYLGEKPVNFIVDTSRKSLHLSFLFI